MATTKAAIQTYGSHLRATPPILTNLKATPLLKMSRARVKWPNSLGASKRANQLLINLKNLNPPSATTLRTMKIMAGEMSNRPRKELPQGSLRLVKLLGLEIRGSLPFMTLMGLVQEGLERDLLKPREFRKMSRVEVSLTSILTARPLLLQSRRQTS
jgi:hypothetical protein